MSTKRPPLKAQGPLRLEISSLNSLYPPLTCLNSLYPPPPNVPPKDMINMMQLDYEPTTAAWVHVPGAAVTLIAV
jgi:hypothetical protein